MIENPASHINEPSSFLNTSAQEGKGSYRFEAKPRPLKAKAKYKEPQERQGTKNRSLLKGQKGENMHNSYSSVHADSKSTINHTYDDTRMVEKSMQDQQQEVVWVELNDRPLDGNTEYDFYVDRPPTAQYKPPIKGKDVAIQIQDNELFDFNFEVEPILQTLVGRALEQSRMELIEEKEIQDLREHKREFEKLRNAELLTTQRLELNFKRKQGERQRREIQHDTRNTENRICEKKYLSRVVSKLSLKGLASGVTRELKDLGFLRNELTERVHATFVPWLYDSILNEIDLEEGKDKYVFNFGDDIRREIIASHTQSLAREVERKAAILEERERIKREKEEARRVRKEIKRQKKISQDKYNFMRTISQTIFGDGISLRDIWEFEILNSEVSPRSRHAVYMPGGFMVQAWYGLCSMHYLYKVIMKKPLDGPDIYVLNEKRITKFFCHLLNEKTKSALNITFNSKYEDLIKEKLNLMETNPEEFSTVREALIQQLSNLDDLTLRANSPLIGCEGSEILSEKIYNMMQSSIIDMIFKISSVHLQQQQQQIPQQKPEDEPKPVGEEPHGDEPKPEGGGDEGEGAGGLKKLLMEKTQEELEILKAKSKILISYHDFSLGLDNKSALLRIRIPLNRSSPIKYDDHKEEERLQKLVQDRQEDNFIELYDGSTYELERQVFEEMDSNSAKTKAFNFGLIPDKQFVLLDEISPIYFSKGFYEVVKTGVREFSLLKLEEFVQVFRKIYKEKEHLQMQEYKSQEYIPIFDYEFFG